MGVTKCTSNANKQDDMGLMLKNVLNLQTNVPFQNCTFMEHIWMVSELWPCMERQSISTCQKLDNIIDKATSSTKSAMSVIKRKVFKGNTNGNKCKLIVHSKRTSILKIRLHPHLQHKRPGYGPGDLLRTIRASRLAHSPIQCYLSWFNFKYHAIIVYKRLITQKYLAYQKWL